ncbi:putative leucine permease transcriptional regulator (SAC3) [Aspergillus alliaceus]|uniref:putative leucine permease transcriptional regulator (SAC3) n=1 Tax=Petromyces alliaceus TaxID=209559 RepID=UPI0012A42EA9|nr:SAC3/GANP/Nin1/mts3/eIF-3 p25 family-domain-containing protein [Aspergillus alliaceus]KAB8236022.1 SAC3/GANP/Nin1/mts3/eIF-3 p25 family-domain-containing protein [Aspergillus alliaceus]
MAGPPNPFAGLNQKDGTTGTAGRGRGGSLGRSAPYQAKNTNAPRDPRARGRGRGAPTAPRATHGHGRGGGTAGNTWRKPESNNGPTGQSASPFAQLKQNQSPSSPFAEKSAPQKPSFSGFGKAPSFGAPSSFDGTRVDSSRDPRKRTSLFKQNGVTLSDVPVEDMTVLNNYNDRYEQLKLDRAKEREKAIKEGQMADPNQPTSLNQAITPVGTCTSMCPEFERVERIVQKMVDKSEKFLHPSTNSLQNLETKMLKRFRRSAAGYDEQLPSDIRTPKTLLQTMNYLIRHVLGGPEPLGLIHKFVWDRTRSIRNDFSVQQVTQEDHVKIAVTCLERIARFHIASLHLLSSPANDEPFDRHQEREQLNNTMLSLMYYYDDNRGRISFPNEDEFRAYYIIFSILDQRPDLEARVQKWPAELRNSPRVQLALELLAAAGNAWEYQGTLDARRANAIAQGFYERFFSLVDSPAVSYLMACVAEIYFNHVRQTAIRSIWKGYCRYPLSQQHKNEEWTVAELTRALYFDNTDQTIKFCEEQDLEFAENANGDLYLNWGSRPIDSVEFRRSSDHTFSEKYVESKRAGRTLVAIILGLNVKQAAQLGMIDSSLLQERPLALPAPNTEASAEDESLFVSDDDNEIPRSTSQTSGSFAQDGVDRDSPISTDSLGGAFEETSQTSTITEPKPAGGMFSQSSNTFQPSSFSPSFATGGSPGAFTASAPSNPFAGLSSLTSSKTPETTNGSSPFFVGSSAPQSTSVFTTESSPFASQKDETSTSNTTIPAFPFKSPSLFQPSTASATPPFSFPTTSTDIKSDQTAGLTAGQSASIFDTIKAPVPSGSPSAIFNISDQSTNPSNAGSQLQMGSPKVPQQPFARPSANFPSPFATNNNETPKSYVPESTIGQPSPIVEKPRDSDIGQERPGVTMQKPFPEGVTERDTPDDLNSLRSNDVSHQEQEAFPSLLEKTNPTELTAPASTEPNIPSTSSHLPTELSEPSVDEVVSIAPDVNERRMAWIETLREAANKRRRTSSTSRKRAHEDQEGGAAIVSGSKAPKVSKPENPVPRKKSMALSSIKPLPKLPILEQIEAMTRKPTAEPKPQPSKLSQVDEDELLLSAARIAAESLRSGPKLTGSWSNGSSEPRRSSFSPRSSFASSLSFSRSQSPQSSFANGYDLALAPDTDLGLGRTLSRTEQRLRLTGGKGLAYKPLDFTPKKKRKSK